MKSRKKITMNRAFNFGAGPAMLPESLLVEAQKELLNWQNLGMSILEIGHRTQPFMQLLEQAEESLRQLLSIPDNYHVLFLGGAARTQFASIPLNFLSGNAQGAYLVSGLWSNMALDEARRVSRAYCVASGEKNHFTAIPNITDWQVQDNTAYLYYTPNETVNGIRFPLPVRIDDAGIPLIADMTSCLLTEPLHIADYGLIFAGAQKNIANAGLTLVIISDELLQTVRNDTLPTMMDYRTHVKNRSLYATPPTFNCYLALKMFQWIAEQGGVQALYALNCQKSTMLYDYIDTSLVYKCSVKPGSRSLINVCFSTQNDERDALFVTEAAAAGLLSLKGHRTVGGLRASMYNSMPLEGVEKLITFMDAFAEKCD